MADIKGITIEIGGDTKKLETALKNVNKTIKTTQGDLKDVNRLLKMNPGNADLLRQKQSLLNTAIGETKTKLDTLKTAMEQMKSEDGFDENSRDAQNLRREIMYTEEELKKLETEARNASSVLGSQMQAAGEQVKATGEKISAVGQGLTTHVTAPIMAIGGLAIKAFSDMDKAEDIVIAKTGATGAELDAMLTSMENLATSIPTDFETAGAAIGEVATRFDLTGQELEDLAGQFVKFAELNDTDVSSSIDAVQSAMAAFGLETKDASAYLDTLNAAGQRTGTSVDKIASDMMTNASALKEMGFSAADAANFLADLNKNGVDSSAVMSGLRRAFANATADGKSMDDALAELQETMTSSETDTEAYAAAMELFGNRAGPALAVALKEGRLSLDQLGASLEDNLGNVDRTFAETLDPLDQFKIAMNELKIVGSEIGAVILEVVNPALIKFRDKIQELREKWDEFDDSQKEMIIKIAGIAAALGPVLMVVGKMTSGVGSLLSIGGKAVTMFSGLGAGAGGAGAAIGASLGPILAVVAAVAALIAIFVELYNNNEDFRNKVNEIWPQIKETIAGVLDSLKEIFEVFVEIVSIIWDQWGDEIWSVVSTKFEQVKITIAGALAVIQGLLRTFASIIQGDWSGAWENLKGTAQTYWETIQAVVGAKLDNLKAKFELFTSIIDTIFGDAWENIKTKAGQKFEEIKNKIANTVDSLRTRVQSIVDRIKQIFKFDFPTPHIKLPHLTITGSLSLVPPSVPSFSVQWYRKAYDNPFLFSAPTVIDGMGFGDGPGAEVVYGHNQLMKDIAAASGGGIDPEAIYTAVREGASDAQTTVVIDNREFARILRNMGVALA